jgi:hypothetical protein
MNANVSTGQTTAEDATAFPRAPAFEPRRTLAGSQPNELDRMRIVRTLVARKRYRYVSPTVKAVQDGYLIESPCCSRRVDPEGGVIDVAFVRFVHDAQQPWYLYRKVHDWGTWELHATYDRLQELLAVLNDDPDRVFWQ